MADELQGRIAAVTGAARGIGRAIALDLARAGADVGVGLRDVTADNGVLDQITRLGRRALPLAMDVTDLAASRAAIDRAVGELGSLDVLVNNAGGSIRGPALEVTEQDFADVWALNVRSTFFLSQHAARHMRDRAGAIVNVASQAGLVALPGEPSYCVAKAAVVHMTRCLAVECGPLGIRVNVVAPTFIEPPGTASVLSDEKFHADTVERIAALHRIGTPDEVSSAVVFLASPAASMVTGHTLVVDGGWTLT